ncbi:MAG: hypothetical protein BGO70_08175 [Bacteroidetes bacterium 43-93]|nr:hypothetical protein [Bacteroidota bacterium]OJW97743.1 MAG: hypothetical protein BGO70_08175 [Bacteroidetes bacterium 43-93]
MTVILNLDKVPFLVTDNLQEKQMYLHMTVLALEFLDGSWDTDEKVEKIYQLMAEPIINYPVNKENVSASRDFLIGAAVDLLLEV